MKRTMKLMRKMALIILFLGVIGNLKAQDAKKALEYMNVISNEYQKISTDMWSYTCAMAHGNRARKIENKRKELIGTIGDAKKRISKMSDFDGDTGYRDSTISYLNISYLVMSEDYSKIVDMEEIAEQSYDQMEAYMTAREMANDKLDVAGEMMSTEHKAFAAKHNITLIEDNSKLNKNLEKAGDVFKYYNVVYLIFFKSNKQEMYLMDALQKSDINALEQNKNTLISYATEGLAKMAEIKSFKSDQSLKIACENMLKFYNKEATEKVDLMRDFLLKKDNYDKKLAVFQSNKSHSEAEVNDYNKMVNDYNLAVNQFNKLSTDLQNERNRLLDAWNNAAKNFLDKNIPAK
ncbi:MAG: hypothetical protein CVU05_15530 [Bacteroidetes bacterium HGW-Bacteroidetes-21]|jgi:putative NADPH-quinone reductase|nr:MAG: hypothetical protein CVU05_15530 [Bacteroidetes bacterium HGW-Bacteroidetes-21]